MTIPGHEHHWGNFRTVPTTLGWLATAVAGLQLLNSLLVPVVGSHNLPIGSQNISVGGTVPQY